MSKRKHPTEFEMNEQSRAAEEAYLRHTMPEAAMPTGASSVIGDGGEVRCKARIATDPPQDCDWPLCGCDLKALNVAERLRESGWTPPAPAGDPAGEPEPSEARLMQTMCGEWMRAIPVVDLPADAARILRENLWQLYDEQPIAPPPAPAAGDVELVAGAINDAVTKWTKTPTDQRERFDVILAALRRVSPAAVEPHAVRQEPIK
jgi:hypothetical protein